MHGSHRAGDFFPGRAGHQKLPLFFIGKGFNELGSINLLQEGVQIFCQPVPIIVFDRNQFGIGLAVAAMRSPEKNLAANHSDKGPIAQNILRVLGLMSANHGNSAGHKLTEVITGRTQHPEFRRRKTRIVLGHGHAAGTDVAGDKNFALRHGIGATIARISMNHNLGPGIEPTDIIRSRAQDFDKGVGKAHGAHPLPGVAGYLDTNRFVSATPEPAADTMLTEGADLYRALAPHHSFLDLLL